MPSECPLCGASTNLVFSDPPGDAPCPNCGGLILKSAHLLNRLEKRFADTLGLSADKVDANMRFDELGADSLDTVETIMELEEEFDVVIPDDVVENIKTIGDVVRFIERYRRGNSDS